MNERMRELGRKGGRASGRARRRLTVEEVEAILPSMDSPEEITARLERISVWVAAGAVSGTAAHALVRACEIGLRSLEARLTREVVDGLRKRLEELEAELRRQRARGVAR